AAAGTRPLLAARAAGRGRGSPRAILDPSLLSASQSPHRAEFVSDLAPVRERSWPNRTFGPWSRACAHGRGSGARFSCDMGLFPIDAPPGFGTLERIGEDSAMVAITRATLVALVVLSFAGRGHAQITCPTGVTMSGTSANDVINGTDQGDRITGNGGQDIIRGNGGSDCIIGGSFNDQPVGGEGNDQLLGEGGDDLLDGGPGDDEIDGGSGKDTIIGGPGNDKLIGEGDDDTFIIHAGDVPAGQVEVINGGSGTDKVIFSFDPGTVTPPNFTVTDPVTKGTYKFVLVEKVEISLCGNGHVDPGEQCDDGNNENGDGC